LPSTGSLPCFLFLDAVERVSAGRPKTQ